MNETGSGNLINRNRHRGGVLLRTALLYTLLFAALSVLVFFLFHLTGRSFVWKNDGLSQHFVKAAYLNKTVRNGVKALLRGEGWTFPLYDFHNGIAALDTQYGFPLILAVLWPQGKIDSFYTFYVVVSYYLTGLAFVYFGWWFRQKPAHILVGALSYAFCGFALFSGVRHPYYVMPMCVLPLVIVGVEKVLRGQRSWVLIGAVFLSLIAPFGVYFSCMQAVFAFLYVCMRFFDLYESDRLRQFIRLCGRLVLWGGTGVLLGCFTAIPTLLEILGGGRIGADIWSYTDPFAYSQGYYVNFLMGFGMDDGGVGSWMHLGFTVLCIPAIFLLFIQRDRQMRTPRVVFLVLTVMHFIPLVGYVMSGFSNVNNRFCFGYAFCAAAILMFMLPRLEEITRKEARTLGEAVAAYGLLCLMLQLHASPKNALCRAAILLLPLAVIYLLRFGFRQKLRRVVPVVFIAVTCACVCGNAWLTYGPAENGYVSQFHRSPYDTLAAGQLASLKKSAIPSEDSTDYFRVAGNAMSTYELNSAALRDYNALLCFPYYGSNALYDDWLVELELPQYEIVRRYYGEERFPVVQTLRAVKYYASRNGDEADWPYGFQKVDEIVNGKNTDTILENENCLPLGYTYDAYMSRSDYDALDAPNKQQAQMEAAVLETAPTSTNIERAEDVRSAASQVPYQVTAADGVVWEDGKLTVEKNNAVMTLGFEGVPGTETYIRVIELDLTDGASNRYWNLTAATENTTARGSWQADAYVYANYRHTQMLDLGYSEDGMTSVTLTFPKRGVFKLEDLQIWCQPMEDFRVQAAALRAEPLEDIETNWRGLTGTVTVSKDKILCLALPWLDGWTAYVDGEETPLLHVNTAFMGVELPAGTHTVEMRYWLPGLTAGLTLTGLGLVCLAGLIVSGCRKRRDG